ncbi:ubiquitinyl hydrolase 1 [Ranunculus cassubicifolius]
MRRSNGDFSVAANAQRRDVDNRISLQKYLRIADNLLKQADIFRGEKNVLDQYIMLLRFSSLITETIPRHKDYKLSPQWERNIFRKKLLNAINELEVLQPVVQQRINEVNRSFSNQVDNSLEWPPVRKQVSSNYEITKARQYAGVNGIYQGQQNNSLALRPVEEQFQKFTLNIPPPKSETLSRHSILGPSGLNGPWHAPIISTGVKYPSNLDLTPVEIISWEQPIPDKVPSSNDSSSESENSTLESLYSLSVDSQPVPTEEQPSVDPLIHMNIIKQPSISPALAEVQDLVPATSPQVLDSGFGFEGSLQDELARTNTPLQLHISTAMMENFMRLAKSNTSKNLETCGILAGSLKDRKFFVTTLIIPKQEGTSDSCQATNEEEIFEVQDKNSLFPLGWIHTHPTQSCFMSSIDIHTHYSYQVMLPEAVAIVMAPKDSSRKHGIFRLTNPGGISVIRNCDRRGFHSHEDPPDGGPIYQHCTDVYMNPNLNVDVIDLR